MNDNYAYREECDDRSCKSGSNPVGEPDGEDAGQTNGTPGSGGRPPGDVPPGKVPGVILIHLSGDEGSACSAWVKL